MTASTMSASRDLAHRVMIAPFPLLWLGTCPPSPGERTITELISQNSHSHTLGVIHPFGYRSKARNNCLDQVKSLVHSSTSTQPHSLLPHQLAGHHTRHASPLYTPPTAPSTPENQDLTRNSIHLHHVVFPCVSSSETRFLPRVQC